MQPAPFNSFSGDPPPPARAFWLRAEDGVRLRAAHWPAETAAGTVLLFTGRTEYLEKYTELAADLNRAGFDLLSLDWRGQGLSDRLQADPRLGHVGDFADYQRDVVELVVAAQELGLPRPWHLLAHSMGGAIGLAALQAGLPVQSAVFSSPMWGIDLNHIPEPLVLAIARLGRGERAAPGGGGPENLVLKDGFRQNPLTGDGQRWGRLVAQIASWSDIALGGPSNAWLGAALLECRRLATLPAPDLPALIALGSREAVVSPAAIRTRAGSWPGAQLLALPDCRHEPMMERDSIRGLFLDAAIRHFNAAATR